MRRVAAVLFLMLAGCGREVDLKPAPGMAPVTKPATAPAAPTVDKLLKLGPEEQPTRTDEPLTRSQPRGQDKFDLPPPG